jgi:hypothetical protein
MDDSSHFLHFSNVALKPKDECCFGFHAKPASSRGVGGANPNEPR